MLQVETISEQMPRPYNVKRRGARVMGAPAHVGQGLRSGGREEKPSSRNPYS